MWVYLQKTGDLLLDDEPVAVGYSGFGYAKNDPASQREVGLGPIPVGAYMIGPAEESDSKGPVVMRLEPLPGTRAWGRSGFLIHGDSREHPGEASHGCIIVNRHVRERVAESQDKLLVVLSGLS